MSQPDGLPSDAWMDARVEAYIDDALPPFERTRFEARLRTESYWQDQVERARSIRVTLRSQSQPAAPTELTEAILRHASIHSCPEPNT